MLRINVTMSESYNEVTSEIIPEVYPLDLEHSLVALSKWEQFMEKPFLTEDEKSDEEIYFYIQCMAVDPNTPPEVFEKLSQANVEAINNYMNAKATATWFNDDKNPPKSRQTITSELIYYWMAIAPVDISCENWHINRLFTLLKIFSVQNDKPKPRNPDEIAAERRAENERRKREWDTPG